MKDYSNFHNINTKAKIEHDATLMLEASLSGYAGKDVLINNTLETKLIINEKYDSDGEAYKIIGRLSDIERGNLIKSNEQYWLVISKPEDNGIYRKATMKLCNSTFPIQTDETSILLTDDEGNPILDIYDDEQFTVIGGELINIPCIVETSYSTKDDNVQLPLPDNSIKVTIQYNNSSCIALNYEFEMYDETYKISHIDKSKVINGVGLLIITAKVVASE